MERITLSEEQLKAYIKPYIDYLNSFELYERFHINNILYGSDMAWTKSGNIKMSLYNLMNVFEPNGYLHFYAIVNPRTMEFSVKRMCRYSGLTWIIKDDNFPVIKDVEMDEKERLIFSGIIANSLWQVKYGEYKRNHCIWSEQTQRQVLGEVADDSL